MDPRQVFDVTEKQRQILEWRHAKRKQLRELYQKERAHPSKSLLFDTGIFRYGAVKTTITKYAVPTVADFLLKTVVVVVPIVLTAWILKTSRDKKEHLYRTGQVSYANRHPKFI